jgi:asparagine synthase (glutamine-hydrolysing)
MEFILFLLTVNFPEDHMSAIIGITNFNQEPLDLNHTKNLLNAYQHYPADDICSWQEESIFLGCHNQWITPESIGEKIPYYDYARQLIITADAIIDNREELFDQLQVSKPQRKFIPDSQLILLAYSKWGEDVPQYLIGEYAFMIWDQKRKLFFGARDFSGARTLYFFSQNNRFAFSTTIEPLFTLPYIQKRLNEEWLAEFIAIPNMVESVDMFSTVYKDISQIPPSHSITVIEGKVNISRYYTIEVKEKLKLKTNEEYEEAFRDVFQRAVTDRLRTYGEVGAHLSGGLDSGSVVSIAASALQKDNKKLHTFSYIPEDSFIDWTDNYYIPNEKPFIKATTEYVGNISDQYLKFEGMSPLDEVDDFLDMMEMPYKFFENSFWLKGINEKAHQQGIKVLLNGARGNHSISWGSMGLTYSYYVSLLKKFKFFRLYQELDDYCKHFKTGKSVMVPFVIKKAFPSLAGQKANNNQCQFSSYINHEFARKTNVYEKLKANGMDVTGASVTNLTEYRKSYYQQLYAWNKSGVVNTKMSLRYSMWDRDPTNDIRVIRFCLSLPEEQYVTKGLERSLIRRATKNLLPDKVRLNQNSRGIQGADVIHRMTKNWSHFINELNQLSNDPRISQFINIEKVKNAILKAEEKPGQEFVFADEFKILTRSLILSRFLKKIE